MKSKSKETVVDWLADKMAGKEKDYKKDDLRGIQGWLLIFVISRFISLFFIVVDLTNTALWINQIYIVIIFFDLILILMSLFFIFRKKSYAPRFIIFMLITQTIGTIIFWLIGLIDTNLRYIILLIIVNILWCLYFYLSKRVHRTFIK